MVDGATERAPTLDAITLDAIPGAPLRSFPARTCPAVSMSLKKPETSCLPVVL